ncbi:hypothetical protein HYFRA_00001146 [Hymenoscyphus fraxineus]|uniref:Hydrophobin n=1 Tax=Hymenoscyphus fraxineus TaxID=746836 RepID=A0A9N9PGZ0_9HELO|nr:hypothetical protein HYFRA_00001146 [Hymenoscyphus fraxineus]
MQISNTIFFMLSCAITAVSAQAVDQFCSKVGESLPAKFTCNGTVLCCTGTGQNEVFSVPKSCTRLQAANGFFPKCQNNIDDPEKGGIRLEKLALRIYEALMMVWGIAGLV